MVYALSDTDLIRKLLVMNIKATTSRMLTVCHTYIAITDSMSSMGPVTKAVNVVQKTNRKDSFTYGAQTKYHAPGRDNCLAKDSTCHACQKTGHWKQKCRKTRRQPQKPRNLNPSHNLNAQLEEEEG